MVAFRPLVALGAEKWRLRHFSRMVIALLAWKGRPMKVIAAMTLSVLVAFGAFGQGDTEGEGEDESAASPVCLNMNLNADAEADDVCFAPIEGYERYTPGDYGRYYPSGGFGRYWRVAVVQYAPQDPTGRAMMVEILRWHQLPLDSRTKPMGGFPQTFVWAELLTESHNGGSEAPRAKPYNVLKRTDAGTLVVEDCDYNPYARELGSEGFSDAGTDYPYAVVLGEGDDLRNVDRMVRRYLEGLANPAVCTLAPCEEPFFRCHGELPSPSCAAQHGAACGAS